MTMKEGKIRPLSICVFSHNDRILVAEGFDPLKQQLFYRPLGGAIEFGEHSRDALVRELREEIQAEITNLRYLATLENIFIFNGQPGHEIVQVYDADFVNPTLYTQDRLQGYEVEIDEPFQIVWKSLADLQNNPTEPLYPDGLLDLLLKPPNPPTP
jgi:8-oxo-dGTP pyrophosphatase MutT (NUDIX family)